MAIQSCSNRNCKQIIREYQAVLLNIKRNKLKMLGKPANLAFDFSMFTDVLGVLMNNTGDPFHPSSHKLDSKQYERKVIDFFSDAYQLNQDDRFGYVTSGGTEGLEFGLLQGIKRYPSGIVYLSSESHYMAFSILKKLRHPYCVIPTFDNGEIDYTQLQYQLNIYHHSIRPAIILANIGTTMKGAIDDVEKIRTAINQKNEIYIHCDAALHGAFFPFLPHKKKVDFLDSISISLHKFLGNITPAGLVICKRNQSKQENGKQIQYISSPNTTLTCSRSGLAAFLAAFRIDILGSKGIQKLGMECLRLSQYLSEQFTSSGYNNLLNCDSNIVYFKAPSDWICKKWMLPKENGYTHAVIMPHVTREILDEFLEDIVTSAQSSSMSDKDNKI